MKKILVSLLLATIAVTAPVCPAADPPAFAEVCATRAAAAKDFALKADAPGWLFLRSELEHVAKGEFWKPGPSPAAAVITKFRETLAAQGVTLVLAPVPAKSAIYPDKLVAGAKPDAVPPLAPFLEELKKTGALVVDLEPAFRAAAASAGQGDPVYCATDSHWSPAGVKLAADGIFAAVKDLPEVKPLLKTGAISTGKPEKLEIKGDLTETDATRATAAETLTVSYAGTVVEGTVKPVPEAADSPIILLGDSHTMVFTDGASLGMHCTGAGLRDQLQAEFGFPLAQISNQNSGVEGARRVLTQRQRTNPQFWKGRKLVVWVFSAKEFTLGKWR